MMAPARCALRACNAPHKRRPRAFCHKRSPARGYIGAWKGKPALAQYGGIFRSIQPGFSKCGPLVGLYWHTDLELVPCQGNTARPSGQPKGGCVRGGVSFIYIYLSICCTKEPAYGPVGARVRRGRTGLVRPTPSAASQPWRLRQNRRHGGNVQRQDHGGHAMTVLDAG